MEEIIINSNDKGQRIDKFLFKVMDNCSKSMVYKWIRTKKIKVNRKRCEIDQILVENDVVQFFIPPQFLKQKQLDFLDASLELNIFFENEDILVVWKNSGLLVHSDINESKDTLIQRVLLYLYQKGEYRPTDENSFKPAMIQRLDRNTEGFVVVAKHYDALKQLNDMMQKHTIHKKYATIIENSIEKTGTLIHYHYKDSSGKIKISDIEKTGYKKIITKYQVLQSYKNYHLIEVELITGKSHQIRAQFSHIGNPIYGDVRYGGTNNGKYQSLSAYKISFHYNEDIVLQNNNNTTFKIFESLKQ